MEVVWAVETSGAADVVLVSSVVTSAASEVVAIAAFVVVATAALVVATGAVVAAFVALVATEATAEELAEVSSPPAEPPEKEAVMSPSSM